MHTKSQDENIRFTWTEFSGSLGDLGLFIPLVVAMTISCGLDIGVVLVLAGLMNILTGWLFRQPIPVQPMKALAAVVITEGLLKEELFAAGLIMGGLLLIFSLFMTKVTQWIPKAVVRGIQLGIGLKLAIKGVDWMTQLPSVGWDSLCSAVFIFSILFFLLLKNKPGLVYIFLVGFLLLYLEHPNVYSSLAITPPQFYFEWPSPGAWKAGLLKGALPQLPLTLLNSVIAVCALSADYFPGRGISPKKMAASVGLMNIICVPFGGIPMCHGAGGLAAQHRFGARTGGSVMIIGFIKVAIGLLFGVSLLVLLKSYPLAVLGPMIVFAGMELAKAIKDVMHNQKHLSVALLTAAVIIGVNTLAGFLAGSFLSLMYYLPSCFKTSK